MTLTVIGIDLGKSTFHVCALDDRHQVAVRRKFSREALLHFMAQQAPCRVGMEACSGAHHLARQLQGYGHEVRLMSPQFVKPYVKSNKNDTLDAEAICEAVTRPTMRFVPIKTVEQQEIQGLHRARELAVGQRTALVNQIRGLLLEQGIVVRQGRRALRAVLPTILEDAENDLTARLRQLLQRLYEELVHLDERVEQWSGQLEALAKADENCQRLMTIPGIGPLVATILIAAVGDVGRFGNGREMAAWAGVVPRQHSTGGKTRLLGIAGRGNRYLRVLLIQGAQAALRWAERRADACSRWACQLQARRGKAVAAVGLANKMVRIAWAVLARGETYRQQALGNT